MGEQGDSGDVGAKGVQGPIGPNGPQGDQGDNGDQGAKGEQGTDGEKGDQVSCKFKEHIVAARTTHFNSDIKSFPNTSFVAMKPCIDVKSVKYLIRCPFCSDQIRYIECTFTGCTRTSRTEGNCW